MASAASDALFQSTPPRGRRPLAHGMRTAKLQSFQSTPPRGRRRIPSSHMYSNTLFQSTPPRGRRLVIWQQFFVGQVYFNPLRREGGDNSPSLRYGQPMKISIHSAARAETSNLLIYLGQTEHFNPLRREGGDKAALTELIGDIPISIHSAARAETICCYFFLWYMKFQSTPPRGRRRPDW